MSHRKSSVPLTQSGGTPLSIHKSLKMRTANRSEFDDHLLRHNQREENRLVLELEQWDKAQRIVTKGMDKDTLWFRQKTQISGNGTTTSTGSRSSAKRHSFSYGTGAGEGYDGQGTKLIPDYQFASRLYNEPNSSSTTTATAAAAAAASSYGKAPLSPRRESVSCGPDHDGSGEAAEGSSSGRVGRKPSSPQGAVATAAAVPASVNSYATHGGSSSGQDKKTRENPSLRPSDASQPDLEISSRRRSETRKEAPRDTKDRSRRSEGKNLRREDEGDNENERRRRKRREKKEASDGAAAAGTEHETPRSQSKGALYLSISPSALSVRKPSPQESQGSSRESEHGGKEVSKAKRTTSPKTSERKMKSTTEARSDDPAIKRGLPEAKNQNAVAGKSHPHSEAFSAPLSQSKVPSSKSELLAPGASQHHVAASPSASSRPNDSATAAAAQAQAAASHGFSLANVGDEAPTTLPMTSSLDMSWDGRRRYNNVWDTLSTPRQKSTVRAVRERLKQEFSSSPSQAGVQPASRRTTPASKTAAAAKMRH